MAFIPFPAAQMGGVIAVNTFAILCTVALVSVAARVSWLAIRSFVLRNSSKPQEYVFFNTQLGNYAGCLLIAMTVNTVAGMMSLPWLINRGITEGAACTAQGFMMQLGTWSSAIFTMSIAVHTFNSLVLKRKQSVILSRCTISIGWVLSVAMSLVPFLLPKTDGDLYGPDGFLCALRPVYPQAQFVLHLLPILFASLLSAVFYSIIFLVLRGTLNIKGGIKLTLDPNERWTNVSGDNYHQFIVRVARSMLWYPVAYVALLVPYSVTRLLVISGFSVPFEAMVLACTCWFMLGVVNVLLLYNTFRVLEPAFEGTSLATSRRDLETYGPEKDYPSLSPFKAASSLEKAGSYTPRSESYRPLTLSSPSSAQGLLRSHENGGSQGSPRSGFSPSVSDTRNPFGNDSESLSSPRAALQKSEALAHSPQSSISSFRSSPARSRTRLPPSPDGRYYPQRSVDASSRTTSARASPMPSPNLRTSSFDQFSYSVSDRQERNPPLINAFRASSIRSPLRSPPRQLTLLADREAAEIVAMPSISAQRLAVNDDDYIPAMASSFTNPRTPPEVPSFLATRR
ncbi:hypothetical protein FA15DRAFT_666648 [Coprinopsis marcescibilis]|uniref:G-protein coupled receptors family 1 profile domain-containing protein n=1 Tax=Coprinopsis marcescibilis TaxID=230819 RepID=A0A5C3L2D9_COPMA|nr:hypothetical protein FA15DRAFT_666648 [Coprinopsis marcescibilis]